MRKREFSTGLSQQMAESLRGDEPEAPKPPPAKFVVVSTPRKGGPAKVFEYDNDATGREQLAKLIRSEFVIAVVLGQRVSIEKGEFVDLTLGNTTLAQRFPFPDQ